ncbi:hypothetical protein GKE73_17210 [Paludibacterium sp. dN 18-1]|uniref:Uncharacterized protein n=1 Tax=Paludibacterium denitrificans TaxID=2675226 RepID=A0A844GI31_9NEIS|nr:hypothetical protein [Paludibacterium denitrificans]
MTAPHALSANLSAAAETAEDSLWPLLHAAQQSPGCVSPTTQQQIAAKLKRPVAEVRGVVEFYHLLSSTPQGEYCLRLSDNITDRFDGNMAILERLQQRLGIDLGHCRADGRVSLHLTSCIGLADQGPAALINGLPLTRLTPGRAGRMAQLIEQRVPVANWPRRWFHINNTVHRAPRSAAVSNRAVYCAERGNWVPTRFCSTSRQPDCAAAAAPGLPAHKSGNTPETPRPTSVSSLPMPMKANRAPSRIGHYSPCRPMHYLKV